MSAPVGLQRVLRRGYARGSAASWSPAALGAELAWYFDPSGLTLAGADIVSASADGAARTLTAAPGARPVVVTDSFGAQAIRTSTATGRLVSATGGPTGAAPWHMLLLLTYNNVAPASGYGLLFQAGQPNAAEYAGLGLISSQHYGWGKGPYGTGAGFNADTTFPVLLEAQYDGAALTLWRDGKLLATGAAHTFAFADGYFGFANWYPSYAPPDATVSSAAFVVGRVLSRAEVQSFMRYEARRLGGKPKAVAFFGDSLTAGGAAGTTPANYIPVAVRAAQSGGVAILPQNEGVTSQRSDQILTRLAAYANPCTHIVWWGGVNDINGASPAGGASSGVAATDAATIYAQTTAAVARIHAIGARAVVTNLAQWGALTGSPYWESVRVAYNALCASNSAGADAVADVSTAMGAYNAANFCADTLHPNDTANATILAPTIYAAILAAG